MLFVGFRIFACRAAVEASAENRLSRNDLAIGRAPCSRDTARPYRWLLDFALGASLDLVLKRSFNFLIALFVCETRDRR